MKVYDMTDVELLKEAKAITGLTQPQIAELVGKSVDTVKSYESGRLSIPAEVFKSLLNAICSNVQKTADRYKFIDDTARRLSKRAADNKKESATI
jgi:transcriptional regulator with XRE-family HTH domain